VDQPLRASTPKPKQGSLLPGGGGGAHRCGGDGIGRGAAQGWQESIWGVIGSRGSPVRALNDSGTPVEEHNGNGLDWRPMHWLTGQGGVARRWGVRGGVIGGGRWPEVRDDDVVPSRLGRTVTRVEKLLTVG
jgi:hypothetical protein